jgi:hypothetical protein
MGEPETGQKHGWTETLRIRLGRNAWMRLEEMIGLPLKVNGVVVWASCIHSDCSGWTVLAKSLVVHVGGTLARQCRRERGRGGTIGQARGRVLRHENGHRRKDTRSMKKKAAQEDTAVSFW